MTSRNGTLIQWNGDGKPSSIGNVGFVYDGLGMRLKKLSGGQTTKYVGGDYEIAPNGTVTKYLVGGKQVGTSFFIHHRDHLGSIQAVTDSAGAEVRRQKHKPFGDQHYASGSHLESKGWIGEREEETELLYLNARCYDPEIARFISTDPLARLGQGLNRYAYSLNNPISFRDPSGLVTEGSVEVVPCVWGLCIGGSDGHIEVVTVTASIAPTPTPTGRPPFGLPGSDTSGIGCGSVCHGQGGMGHVGGGGSGTVTGNGTGTGAGTGTEPGTDHDVTISPGDLQVGDVLITADGGLASSIASSGDGQSGHTAMVTQVGDNISVLSADDRGTYEESNSDPAVGGRIWDVYRVNGVDVELLAQHVDSLNMDGGLSQYLFGGVCSQVVCRALNASIGSRAHPLFVETATPWNLAQALGPPIGRVYLPRRRVKP